MPTTVVVHAVASVVNVAAAPGRLAGFRPAGFRPMLFLLCMLCCRCCCEWVNIALRRFLHNNGNTKLLFPFQSEASLLEENALQRATLQHCLRDLGNDLKSLILFTAVTEQFLFSWWRGVLTYTRHTSMERTSQLFLRVSCWRKPTRNTEKKLRQCRANMLYAISLVPISISQT